MVPSGELRRAAPYWEFGTDGSLVGWRMTFWGSRRCEPPGVVRRQWMDRAVRQSFCWGSNTFTFRGCRLIPNAGPVIFRRESASNNSSVSWSIHKEIQKVRPFHLWLEASVKSKSSQDIVLLRTLLRWNGHRSFFSFHPEYWHGRVHGVNSCDRASWMHSGSQS